MGSIPTVVSFFFNFYYQEIEKSTNSYKQSGSTVLQKFKGYFNILQQAFPDVTFDSTAFIYCKSFSLFAFQCTDILLAPWRVITNRKRFFENYAKEHGFDPLVPENWYLQSRKRIANYKVLLSAVPYFLCFN